MGWPKGEEASKKNKEGSMRALGFCKELKSYKNGCGVVQGSHREIVDCREEKTKRERGRLLDFGVLG